jgi:hypothetical protein
MPLPSGTTDVLITQLRLIFTVNRRPELGIELSVWERDRILIPAPHPDVKLWGFFEVTCLVECKIFNLIGNWCAYHKVITTGILIWSTFITVAASVRF